MIAATEPSLTVLIIKDEQAIRRFVRAVLEGEGYRVHEANTVQRGLLEADPARPRHFLTETGIGYRFCLS